MRDLALKEIILINGAIWCTYHGYPGQGAGNQIEIDGDDCTILRQSIQVTQGSFDYGSMAMTAAAAWSGFILTCGATAALGFGTVASGGVGLVFALAVGTGYAASHRG